MSQHLSFSILLCATWAAAAAVPRAHAQTLDVFWSPEQPVVGTLFVVRVGWSEPAGGPTSLRGWFADEPLHFHEREGGGRWAIAAMPAAAAWSMPSRKGKKASEARTASWARSPA